MQMVNAFINIKVNNKAINETMEALLTIAGVEKAFGGYPACQGALQSDGSLRIKFPCDSKRFPEISERLKEKLVDHIWNPKVL